MTDLDFLLTPACPTARAANLRVLRASLPACLLVLLVSSSACTGQQDDGGENQLDADGDPTQQEGSGDSEESGDASSDGPTFDDNGEDDEHSSSQADESEDSGTPGGCQDGDVTCKKLDLLFVVDNSGTMGEEQLNLAQNFPRLLQQLFDLKTPNDVPVRLDTHLMVTTTDMGHPLCTPHRPEGQVPARGTPVASNCLERIGDFTGLDKENPVMHPEACTDYCEDPELKPLGESFIHFGPGGQGSNVPNDEIADALSCVSPQGINGCGYEAPLESMMQALYPGSAWNDPRGGNQAFLRDDAILAIVVMTDEADCSVYAPDGYAAFTDGDEHWEVNPDGRKLPSSAICWNAGVDCSGGVCTSANKGVLQPVSRYIDYLNEHLVRDDREVVMLGILGVPKVTDRAKDPPYEPIAGGVFDLEYRDWRAGDLAVGDPSSVAQKQFEFGIGPGCTARNAAGDVTGQAMPPVRIKEVCESLNRDVGGKDEKIRCCIESICDEDFSAAMRCLSGLIRDTIPPAL